MKLGFANGVGLGSTDSALVVVPLYHANSWGFAFACPMMGARMILPGTLRSDPGTLRIAAAVTAAAKSHVLKAWRLPSEGPDRLPGICVLVAQLDTFLSKTAPFKPGLLIGGRSAPQPLFWEGS